MATIFKKYDVRLVQEHSGLYDLDKKITSSVQAAEICKQLYDIHNLSYEKMVAITLNTKLEVVGCFEVARGTIDESPVYVREIATRALLTNAKSVILAHNHPSGAVDPSRPDIKVTKKVKDALTILGVNLLDHIIVSCERTYSMADHGLI
jgi:DNA repair protein RadC